MCAYLAPLATAVPGPADLQHKISPGSVHKQVGAPVFVQNKGTRASASHLRRAAPVDHAAVFAPPANNNELPKVSLNGFCLREDGSSACETPPCCCWSTFAKVKFPSYERQDEVEDARRCMNPPAGYLYIPAPGMVYDDGEAEVVKLNSNPMFEGRNLCCIIDKTNPKITSQVREYDQVCPPHRIKDGMCIKETTTTPEVIHDAFKTTVATTTREPFDEEEYETAALESAARSHALAAQKLKDAATSLNGSMDVLDTVRNQMLTSPAVLKKKAHIEKMKHAISEWSHKRWHNFGRLAARNETGMLH